MATPPGADTETTFLSGVADQLKQIREDLGYPADAGGRGVTDPAVPRQNYMAHLNAQLQMEQDPDRPTDTGDPFGDYLEDVSYQIKEGARRLREQGRREWQGLTDVDGEIVCCIVNGLYQIIASQGGADDVDRVRRVAEDDIRKWVRLLRELLVASRETLTTGGAAAGQLNFQISLLQRDLTAIIMDGIEAGLASVLFMAHELVADLARDADEEVTSKIARTRCAPLMRIWASIYDYLFSGSQGIISRTRGMLRDVLVKQARKRRKQTLSVGIGGEIDAESRERYLRWIDDLINILDAILAAISVLSICRVPRADDPDQNEGEAFAQDFDTANPGPTRPTPYQPGDPERVPPYTSTEEPDQPVVPSGYGLVQTNDPDLGRISVLEPDGETEDYIYLTPTNVAALMTKAFDIEPSEALDIAGEQRCRDNIDDDTEEVLVNLGVLPSE